MAKGYFPSSIIAGLKGEITRLKEEVARYKTDSLDEMRKHLPFHFDEDGNPTEEYQDRCGHCGTYYDDMPRRYDRAEELKTMKGEEISYV